MFVGKLKPGDRVKIVDKWTGTHHNIDGRMNKYLGTIMTVSEYKGRYGGQNIYTMVEDLGNWSWYDEMIVSEVINDFSDDEKENFVCTLI